MPTQTKKNVIRTAAATVLAAGALGAVTGSAQAAVDLPEFEIDVDRNAIERTIEAAKHRRDYRQAFHEAKELKVEPKVSALSTELGPDAAEARVVALEKRVKKAKEPEFGTPESVGVSSSTLETIASCESGGDPTAISSDGTYRGKYQFDMQTWASMGGSGDPAAASEEEQDYRAAMLYSQSGSSPWPVCGV